MRQFDFAVAAALTLASVTACSDSTSPEELAGTYNVTVFEFTNPDSTAQTVDLVDLGLDVTVTITAAGAFSFTVDGDTESGTMTIDGSDVTITIGGDPATGTISQDGDTVTIELDTGVEFDLDDDGTDDPATLRIVMTRTT
jgi:hypothetical protein